MKITLNELRKLINNNLLIEALNFEGLVAQNPPFYQTFYEKFIDKIIEFKSILYRNSNQQNSFNIQPRDNQLDDKIIKAYMQYMLICVIEKGMSYEPISLRANANTTFNTLKFDLDNPTGGLKGRYTEFIVKILSSNFFYIDLSDEEQIIRSFQLLNAFINICDKPSSNVYKDKMNFFDTQVMNFIAELHKQGKFRNIPKINIQSPLADKVAKVFNEFGSIAGKNLINVMLTGIIFDEENIKVKTFAGYDIKLIDFCLQHNYWNEMKFPNQPESIRLFYLNNGNFDKAVATRGKGSKSYDDFAANWWDTTDFSEYEREADGDDAYYDELREEALERDWANYQTNAILHDKNIGINFSYRAMVHACNIYPFRTPYNTPRGIINDCDIPYYKGLQDDDCMVLADNPEYGIRKTTAWCTKDLDLFMDYINGTKRKVDGFLFILDDSLPYNHPDGAALVGIEFKKAIPITRGISGYSDYIPRRFILTSQLNAYDKSYTMPTFIVDYFNNDIDNQYTRLNNMFDIFKKKYDKLNQLNLKDEEKNNLSGQQLHSIMQRYLNNTNMNENQVKLLRKYIKSLLL